MRNMIDAGLIAEARNLVREELPDIYESNIRIRANFDALEFLSLIEAKDFMKALDFCQTNLSHYMIEKQRIMLKTLSEDGVQGELNILDLAGLLCYPEAATSSPFAYLFSEA